jgi:hypothetical protein
MITETEKAQRMGHGVLIEQAFNALEAWGLHPRYWRAGLEVPVNNDRDMAWVKLTVGPKFSVDWGDGWTLRVTVAT